MIYTTLFITFADNIIRLVMIIWQRKDYGFHLTLSGIINKTEINEWVDHLKETVSESKDGFYVFVDMRELEILPSKCKAKMEEGQTFCKDHGMIRSVVILSNNITAMQFKLIAKKTGIYKWERYIDALNNSDWEQLGMDWILHAVDPDKKLASLDNR